MFSIWDFPGIEATERGRRILRIIMSPETTGTKEFTLVAGIIPPGGTTGYHRHDDANECMYVASGRGECMIERKTTQIAVDSVIYAPIRIEHEVKNTGDETLKLISFFAPPWKIPNAVAHAYKERGLGSG